MITPVLLCGGSGTRLWPLSRKSYPKQFSPLTGGDTLFQTCARRLTGHGYAPPLVVTADPFRFIAQQQLAATGIAPSAIMIEPDSRDTGPAILAAALQASRTAPRALLLVAPTDHVIADPDSFHAAVAAAKPAALDGQIVTFGIAPDRPETGYGYLELDAPLQVSCGAVPLRAFIEKPDACAAAQMLAEGRYLWNAGIFLFTADTIIAAYRATDPDTLAAVEQAVAEAQADLDFQRLAAGPWQAARASSIDYAVMEHADNLSVVPYHGRWSDLGDWAAVWRETEADGMSLSATATAIACNNTLLRSEVPEQAIVGIGLDDLVVVAMPDAVLVSHKSRTQEVKQAVQMLKAKKAPQAEAFPKDHRPWGWFESLVFGDRFQVKRIVVNPGAALSLQSHHHRAEHWVVVAGTAKVTIDNRVELVTENQSVYIPLGARHRLENPGKLPMILIEIQTGAYLGEDDIQRYDDVYARV